MSCTCITGAPRLHLQSDVDSQQRLQLIQVRQAPAAIYYMAHLPGLPEGCDAQTIPRVFAMAIIDIMLTPAGAEPLESLMYCEQSVTVIASKRNYRSEIKSWMQLDTYA